jgi:transcriptional regulator GlxA family with amidase domain
MDIVILLYEHFTALDAIGPMEVLSSVPGAQVHFVAEQAGSITNDTGLLTVQVNATLDDLPQPDVIVIPGGPGCIAVMQNAHVLNWLRMAHASARWTSSVCTGSLILGAAGLLQGAPATTHWASHTELAAVGAIYVRERFVQHGTIITAAGVSAGIDMALWLAAALADPATAGEIQLALEYDPEPPAPMITPPVHMDQLSPQHRRVMQHRMGRSGAPNAPADNQRVSSWQEDEK